MKKILVLAYSVSPLRGSEFSVGWNYIKEMSKDNHLIVLFGMAGGELGNFEEVLVPPVQQSLPNVHFIPVVPSQKTLKLNALNKRGVFTYSFYAAYRSWHKQAYQAAIDVMKNTDIDIIHYLCPIGYREPGYLWKIDKPYIWGPIGGLQNRPLLLSVQKSYLLGLKTLARNLANSLQRRFSSRVRSAMNRSDVILASTSENQKIIEDIYKQSSTLFPENGITSEMVVNQKKIKIMGSALISRIHHQECYNRPCFSLIG